MEELRNKQNRVNSDQPQSIGVPRDIADPAKWIIKLSALLDKLKHSKSAYDLTTKDLPYVYQSEYYNTVRGPKHHGFFISPNGKMYTYNNPRKWNKADKQITPYELIQNFCNSKLRSTIYRKRKSFELTHLMIDDLLKSPIHGKYNVRSDAGKRTNVLWLYDNNLQLYKKILFSGNGDDEFVNTSLYAKQLIKDLGEV